MERKVLEKLYLINGASMQEIATQHGCSVHKIAYYMDKYQINRRSISEAVYKKHNPNGDPYKIKPIATLVDAQLLGLGLGLYWGEGTKANKHSVRLGNSDPQLIKQFMLFLIRLFGVKKSDFHFSLQIFSDIEPSEALLYWSRTLKVETSQFYKTTVTISGSIGTYRQKSKYGVVTLYYHNKKLRDLLVESLPR